MDNITKAVIIYRALNKKSRAVAGTTWYGSSSRVRRATCIFCKHVVATSCGDYPETKKSIEARISHSEKCALNYLKDKKSAYFFSLGIKLSQKEIYNVEKI